MNLGLKVTGRLCTSTSSPEQWGQSPSRPLRSAGDGAILCQKGLCKEEGRSGEQGRSVQTGRKNEEKKKPQNFSQETLLSWVPPGHLMAASMKHISG